MTITLTPDIEESLRQQAVTEGTTLEAVALSRLQRNYYHNGSAKNGMPKGVPPSQLRPFIGTISHEEAALMLKAVEQDDGEVRQEDRSAKNGVPKGVHGASLHEFVGTLTQEESEEMMRVIDEDCGKVDWDGWR